MKTGLLGSSIVLVMLISTADISHAERGRTLESSRVVSLKLMDKMSASERESLLVNFTDEWQATKERLIQNLFSEHEQTRFCAAYLLGLYRYADACGNLAKVIAMENEDYGQQQSREPRWGQYPAVEALIHIGKPAIPAMLRNLETSDDEHVRGLSARVIHYVEGSELAKKVVQNAVAKQKNPEQKRRLESGLPLVRGGEYAKPDKP